MANQAMNLHTGIDLMTLRIDPTRALDFFERTPNTAVSIAVKLANWPSPASLAFASLVPNRG
jgi:hypothetical protein